MSDADRLRRAAAAKVRRAPRDADTEAQRLRRNAEAAAEAAVAAARKGIEPVASVVPGRAADAAPDLDEEDDADGDLVAPAPDAEPKAGLLARVRSPSSVALLGDDPDAFLVLHGDPDSGLEPEDEALYVIESIRDTTFAPDPFDDAPEARAVALAPMVHGGPRAFGLSRLPAEFHALTGSGKLDWLLSLPDPRASIQALPAEELVFLLDEIGLSDGPELFALASARQLQVIVDLMAWRRDDLDKRSFAHLLAVAVAAGDEVVDRFLVAQEDGVITSFLFGHARIFEGFEDAEEGAPQDWDVFSAPDGHMQIAVDATDTAVGPIRAIVDSLFRTSIERGRRVLRALRWELPMSLLEDLHETRGRRLGDLGMMPRDEAMELFAFVDPDTARTEIEQRLSGLGDVQPATLRPYLPDAETDVPAERTDLALRGAPEPVFLAAAAALLPLAEAARVQTALCFAAYRLQAALAEHMADTEALQLHARWALCTIDLGLRFAARESVERGAVLLTTEPVERLFAIGHGQVVLLHHRAVALRRRLGGANRASMFDGADGAIVRGLLRPLPMWPARADELVAAAAGSTSAEKIRAAAAAVKSPIADAEDDGTSPFYGAGDGADDDDGLIDPDEAQERADAAADEERFDQERAERAGMRPYESATELRVAAEAMARLDAVLTMLEFASDGSLAATLARIDLELEERAADIDISAMLATAVAWAVLDGRPRLQPLDGVALARLLAEAMEGQVGQRSVRADLRKAIARAVLVLDGLSDEGVAGLERAIDAALDRIDAELGGLDPRGRVDVRFIGNSLLVRGRGVDPTRN